MLNFYDFIQVFVFTTNHRLNVKAWFVVIVNFLYVVQGHM